MTCFYFCCVTTFSSLKHVKKILGIYKQNLISLCYQTQVQLFTVKKSIIKMQILLTRKHFNQKASNLGRRCTHISQNQPWRFYSAMIIGFKRENNPMNHQSRIPSSSSFYILCTLPKSSWSFFRCYFILS